MKFSLWLVWFGQLVLTNGKHCKSLLSSSSSFMFGSPHLRSVHTRRQVAATCRGNQSVHSMCTGRATSCSNKVRWHVAATNCFVCTGEFLWKSLSPQQNFVAATRRKKSNQTESARLVVATNSVAATKIFTKILQYTRSDLSLQYVTATCRCNLSSSVYRPLRMRDCLQSWMHETKFTPHPSISPPK